MGQGLNSAFRTPNFAFSGRVVCQRLEVVGLGGEEAVAPVHQSVIPACRKISSHGCASLLFSELSIAEALSHKTDFQNSFFLPFRVRVCYTDREKKKGGIEMPKSPNQKLKLLVLLRFLERQSDEKHPVTLAQMLEELARWDISAERKSLYDDLETLRSFGADVVTLRGKTPGYYLGARDFELPELKLLVDSIQSSKFITGKKTLALIRKLEGLCSVHEAQVLERQVFVRGRVKSMNESVYYNVDAISDAISRDRALRFRYFEFTVAGERHYRHEGGYYQLSPYALIWDDENYYMLAWDEAEGRFKHFRVDKMTHITALDRPRDGKDAFAQLDMSVYSQRVFGMFAGETQPVRMRFARHLAGAVIDRFGKEVLLIPEGEESFTVTAEVAVSPQFFAWVFGFGTEAEILSPEAVRREAGRQAADIAAKYRE